MTQKLVEELREADIEFLKFFAVGVGSLMRCGKLEELYRAAKNNLGFDSVIFGLNPKRTKARKEVKGDEGINFAYRLINDSLMRDNYVTYTLQDLARRGSTRMHAKTFEAVYKDCKTVLLDDEKNEIVLAKRKYPVEAILMARDIWEKEDWRTIPVLADRLQDEGGFEKEIEHLVKSPVHTIACPIMWHMARNVKVPGER